VQEILCYISELPIFAKNGGVANNWFGGNTFGTSTINKPSNRQLRLANNSGE